MNFFLLSIEWDIDQRIPFYTLIIVLQNQTRKLDKIENTPEENKNKNTKTIHHLGLKRWDH